MPRHQISGRPKTAAFLYFDLGDENCAPSWIRTNDPLLKRQVLYRAELWAHIYEVIKLFQTRTATRQRAIAQ